MNLNFKDYLLLITSVNLEAFWYHLPIFLVWVTGLILAWRRRKQYPRICRVAFVALAGFLLDSLLGTFLGTVLAAVSRDQDWSRESVEILVKSLGFAENVLTAILWGLVLVAIFGERQVRSA